MLHLFTPHHSNNQRPKTLHPSFLIFYIIFFLLLEINLGLVQKIRPDILGIATNITIERLYALTNQKRGEAGLPQLILNKELSQAANLKAQDMFSKDYWAHNSPSGGTPWEFILAAGYRYFYAGENLAKDFNDSDGVVSAWINSSSHKENILKSEYRDIGFAVVNGKLNGQETTLVVQMFGAGEAGAAAQKQAVIPPVAAASFPSPTLSPILPTPTPMPSYLSAEIPVAPGSGGNILRPRFDIIALMAGFSSTADLFLIGILVVDGFLIWQRRTVRLAGHNFAHILFLGSILGVVWLKSLGVIL